MDFGQLYQFLSAKGCGDVFQMFFGVEGQWVNRKLAESILSLSLLTFFPLILKRLILVPFQNVKGGKEKKK
jgi:DNA-binding transcriptional regulator LsrR (DeoR family)